MTHHAGTPLAEGLFTWPSDSPALIGTRCGDCGEVTFPSHYGCPRCASEAMVPFELEPTGTVWTWTTQNFRPPPPYSGPEEFTPYHVGYVELAGEVIVETYLTGYGDGRPTIGDDRRTGDHPVLDERGRRRRRHLRVPTGQQHRRRRRS